jgi:pimeloyl-ACP methyl ester carboxylesterase
VGGLLRTLAGGVSRALSTTAPLDAPSIAEQPRGRIAIGALNGAFGDALERSGNPLTVRMAIRCGGRDVVPAGPALAAAFPDATSRLALFVHGLCETDDAWKLGAAAHVPYGTRLQAELGYTPLYLRYNTGRHISENGRELASLLDRLASAWPVEVHEVAIIGHSMGGLVARSACHYGGERSWVNAVRHLVMLGAPHRGAPLEQVAHAASVALRRLPETRGFGMALNARSSGIKDLGRGYLVDEDWQDPDAEAWLARVGSEIPFLRTANHYFVCATISREADAPVGRVMGDLLVLPASAWAHTGRGQRMRFPVANYRHLGSANHFDLLNHPAIYDQIRGWLATRPALPETVA